MLSDESSVEILKLTHKRRIILHEQRFRNRLIIKGIANRKKRTIQKSRDYRLKYKHFLVKGAPFCVL